MNWTDNEAAYLASDVVPVPGGLPEVSIWHPSDHMAIYFEVDNYLLLDHIYSRGRDKPYHQ